MHCYVIFSLSFHLHTSSPSPTIFLQVYSMQRKKTSKQHTPISMKRLRVTTPWTTPQPCWPSSTCSSARLCSTSTWMCSGWVCVYECVCRCGGGVYEGGCKCVYECVCRWVRVCAGGCVCRWVCVQVGVCG